MPWRSPLRHLLNRDLLEITVSRETELRFEQVTLVVLGWIGGGSRHSTEGRAVTVFAIDSVLSSGAIVNTFDHLQSAKETSQAMLLVRKGRAKRETEREWSEW